MSAENGAVSTVAAPEDTEVVEEEALAGLRRQAQHLIAELTGPVRRIRLRSGPAVLEVEWHPENATRPDAPATPATAEVPPAARPPAAPSAPGRAA
ncbi:acetyl-CoA carboxylase biotin carboxyl carrier protein, partial [Micromonospora chokoriensis]